MGLSSLIDVLRTACHGGPPVSLADLGEGVVAWAAETGLGPLVARVVAGDPAAAGSPLWPLVQGVDLTARFLAAQQIESMTEILDACAGRLPPPVLLKGISLCERHYPEPHLRPMRDLDFLVEAEMLGEVEAILSGLGYRQCWSHPRAFYAGHHHSAPFLHAATGVWVDVHRALFASQSEPGGEALFAGDLLRAELRPSRFHGRPVRRLSDELQLVHLASHWARGLRTVGGMIAMADVAFLLRDALALDWARVAAWTRGSAAARHLYLLLTYLDRHHLIGVVPEIVERLGGRRAPLDRAGLAVAHGLLDRYVVDGRPFGPLLSERTFTRLWRVVALGRPILHPPGARETNGAGAGGFPEPGGDAGDVTPASEPAAEPGGPPAADPAGEPAPDQPCPARCVGVQGRVVGGATVVLDRRRLRIHRLNETAGYIWDRCDGRRSAMQIGREVAGAFGIPADLAQRDVAAIVRQFVDAGLVELRSPAVSPPR